MSLRLPHPLVLLVAGVAAAASLTWLLPAGEYDRRDDPTTGRLVVVAGTYHPVDPEPVGPFGAIVALPRGFVAAADVVAVILFVGGAWVVVDEMGTLGRLVGSLLLLFRRRGFWILPILSFFFASMGALENMQEEIIPLVPVLLILGRRLGVDAVTVVGLSLGSAMVGSAFGPTNPFQAGIAMQLAGLPPLSGGGLRLIMFLAGVSLWTLWTVRHAAATRTPPASADEAGHARATGRDLLIIVLLMSPMAAYVYGAMFLGWGFDELSAGFFAAGVLVGIIGGLGIGGTTAAYLKGMQALLPAAVLVAVARSISIVLADGHVIDTILHGLATPLAGMSTTVAALLMVPVHGVIHVLVPSVSGHAVLTMPVLVPLSDLLNISRQATVLAYQTGAGLTELLTPTNGALMAVLLAAGVPYQQWVRFAAIGVAIVGMVGIAGILVAM